MKFSKLNIFRNSNLFSLFFLGVFLLGGSLLSFRYYCQTVQDVYYRLFDINKTFTWKEIPEGIYRIDAKGGLDSILLSQDRWKDFSLTSLLIHPRDCAVIFDYQGPEHFYFLYFDQNERTIFWAVVNEKGIFAIKKIPWPSVTVQFPLDLRVKDNQAQLFLSGQLLSEIPFDSSHGKVGLMLKDASLPKTIFGQIEFKGHTLDGRFIEVNKFSYSVKQSWGLLGSLVLLFLMMIALAIVGAFMISRVRKRLGPPCNWWSAALIHLFIAAILFWPFILRGEVLISSSDNFGEIFPLFFYSKQLFWQILKGESLGLWNPYVHNGVSFFSNHWNMIYYPLNWIVFLFSDKNVMTALTFKTFLEVFAVGIFAYGFFVHALGSRRWALFCSVVYQMCSLLIFCLTIFPAISLYLAMTMYLYFLWSFARRSALANYFWLTCSIIMIFTSANMVFIFYSILSLGTLTLYRVLSQNRSKKLIWQEFGWVVGSWFSAFLISAIRLIPCTIGIMESNRIVQNYYTIHDRLFLWIRLFIPEIVFGFDVNPLTDPNTNVIFRSIDMPSNAQNAFFVYFGVLGAALLFINFLPLGKLYRPMEADNRSEVSPKVIFLTFPNRAHGFWKVYAFGVLAVSLLFQPVWGILSILFFPLVHYSYHIIILPAGICMLLGYTGMYLERKKINLNQLSHKFVLGVLLVEALLVVIITYMLPQLTAYSRMIIFTMILWYAGYSIMKTVSLKSQNRYLSKTVWGGEAILIVVFLVLTTVLLIKPIAQKEDIYQNIILPTLFFLLICSLSIRTYFGFFFRLKKRDLIGWGVYVGLTCVLTWLVISSRWFWQFVNSADSFRNYFVDFTIGELRFFLVLGIGVGVFILFLIKVLSARMMVAAWIVLTIADLFVFNAHFDSVVAPSFYNRAFFSPDSLYRDKERNFESELDLVNYRTNHLDEVGLFANKNLIVGVPSYTGIIGYMPRRFSDLVKSFGYPPTTVLIYPKDSTDSDRFLDLSAVKYDFIENNGVRMRENALSRLSLVYGYRVIEDDQSLLKELHNPSFDPQKEILLSQNPGTMIPDEGGIPVQMVPIHKATSDVIETQVNVSTPGWLLFSESYHAGWTAFIDGKRTPIYLANYNFMACPIFAGEHTVRFEFKPSEFYISLKISLLGLGLFICVLSILATRLLYRRLS